MSAEKATPIRRGRKSKQPGQAAPSAAALAYDGLRAAILSYEIRPGDKLNEMDLARQFGVSRTPLREALIRLSAERLIHFEPDAGFVRPRIVLEEIAQLYEFRVLLETVGIGLAVTRATDAEIAALERFWAEARTGCAQKTDAELIAEDEAFHEGLAALSHNDEILQSLRNVNARIHFIRWADPMGDGLHSESYRAHYEVLEALRARDGVRAESLLRGIIEKRRNEIVDVLKEGAARLFIS